MSAQTGPAREDKGTLISRFALVVIVEMVQPEEWVETLNRGKIALLPIDPPKINALFFERVMKYLEICLCKILIGNIKRTGSRLSGSTPMRVA